MEWEMIDKCPRPTKLLFAFGLWLDNLPTLSR